MKKIYRKDTPAMLSFELFCERNETKPTNLKADYYLAGYYAGQRYAQEHIFELLPEELDSVISQNIPEHLKELLRYISSGYKVVYKYNPYPIESVLFYKFEEDKFAALLRYNTKEGYRLEHINDATIVPF